MKILQVCSASEMGGGEVHVADLARGLTERGHALYFAVRPDSPLRKPLSGLIASWHEMPLRNSLDLQSAAAIANLVNRHGIDIVHAHMGRDYLVTAMANRRTPEAKLILTRHHYLPLKRNLLYRWMLQDVSAIIAVSEPVRASVIERLNLPADRVHTIPNWVDVGRFHLIERNAARAMFSLGAQLTVACIGQITPAKGQEEFIRAAARVSQSRRGVEFLIVGEENHPGEPFTAELRQLAESLGIQDRVRFTGYVADIPAMLAGVDVVVVPSWDEGFSLVTIEAMAAGRPVLASNVGAIGRIIQDGVSGFLFPARDVKAMANRLNLLLAEARLRDRLAGQARRYVEQEFNRDRVIDRIVRLYEEALQKG